MAYLISSWRGRTGYTKRTGPYSAQATVRQPRLNGRNNCGEDKFQLSGDDLLVYIRGDRPAIFTTSSVAFRPSCCLSRVFAFNSVFGALIRNQLILRSDCMRYPQRCINLSTNSCRTLVVCVRMFPILDYLEYSRSALASSYTQIR